MYKRQARYRLPVIWVIFNNTSYRILKQRLVMLRGLAEQADKFVGMELNDPAIDFVGLARSLGIEGIPRDRVRLHVCYGNWEGPHIHDVALDKILPALYQAKVGALSIEFSNPRHAHEYAALKRCLLYTSRCV